MLHILEPVLTFLSGVGEIIFKTLFVLAVLYVVYWIIRWILEGKFRALVVWILGRVIKIGSFLFMCTALGAYAGYRVEGVLFDTVWIQAFFALGGMVIGGFVLISLAGRKE